MLAAKNDYCETQKQETWQCSQADEDDDLSLTSGKIWMSHITPESKY